MTSARRDAATTTSARRTGRIRLPVVATLSAGHEVRDLFQVAHIVEAACRVELSRRGDTWAQSASASALAGRSAPYPKDKPIALAVDLFVACEDGIGEPDLENLIADTLKRAAPWAAYLGAVLDYADDPATLQRKDS